MRTREEILKELDSFSSDGRKQELAATVQTVILLLDIRDLLAHPMKLKTEGGEILPAPLPPWI